jgi:hypothetical protein
LNSGTDLNPNAPTTSISKIVQDVISERGLNWQWWTSAPPHKLAQSHSSASSSKTKGAGLVLGLILLTATLAMVSPVLYRKYMKRVNYGTDDSETSFLKDGDIRVDLADINRLYDNDSL